MQKVFLVWYDNQQMYGEDEVRYILKAFTTREKAEQFIHEHCSEEFKPSKTFEEFEQGCVLIPKAILGTTVKKLYDNFVDKEKREFIEDRDPSTLEIEELDVL